MTAGAASDLLSLPQGGGAQHGIGETFTPDLHTGTANSSIPIKLPPGRNGLEPQLNLRYSSGAPNGPFGLGDPVALSCNKAPENISPHLLRVPPLRRGL